MKYSEFKRRTLEHLSDYKEKQLGITDSGKWKTVSCPHILPEKQMSANLLPMVKLPQIKVHSGACHLNSSQMMCVNFFEPLIHDVSGKRVLRRILSECTGISFDSDVKRAEFEYIPHEGGENTNFDFFLEFTDGGKIYFEIKYTEECFGGVDKALQKKGVYSTLWRNLYKARCNDSLYLSGISEEEFYSEYQIYRIMTYIRTTQDYAFFVYPFGNDNLKNQFAVSRGAKCPNVRALCWSELAQVALKVTEDTEYYTHFRMFSEKYIWNWK